MKLLLTNVVWDNTYKETRYFENVSVRNEWFGLPDSLVDRPNVNFNVGGDLLASCVINNDVASNLTRMNYNYIIVHDEVNDEYLFYFINSCRYINARQIQYNLELDVLTTYLPTISALPSHMYSAHIDRFKKSNDQVIYFDTGYQSKIWLEDIPNLAKRLRYKVPIKWKYTSSDTVNEWLYENVACWVYCFMTPKEYTININTSEKARIGDFNYNLIDISQDGNINPYLACVCVPVLKNNKQAFLSVTNETTTALKTGEMNMYSLYSLLDRNEGNAHVHSYVISMQPPNRDNTNFTYSITNDKLYVNTSVDEFSIASGSICGLLIEDAFGLPVVQNIALTPITSYPIYLSQIGYTTLFDKEAVKSSNYGDFTVEPKLSKMNVKELQITSSFGNNFTFDGLKALNEDQSITFNLYEPITPGTNASLVRPIFNDESDGVYQNVYNNEVIGLLTNYDSTLPYATSYIDQFLASNKNFFMQKVLDIGVSYGTSMLNAISRVHPVSTPVNATTSIADYLRRGIDLQLTLDNMRNAPSTYQDSASNILLDLSILTDFGYYVEVWDALDIDKKIYLDNINHFGYVLNIEDDMTKYFKTRKYFNYVRGDIHSISNNLSNAVKNKIKSIFNNGVRLFHRDIFEDPDRQNYELSLED